MGSLNRKWIFIAVTIVSFGVNYLATSLTIALPVLGKDLLIPRNQLTWITGIFALTTAVSLVPFGKMADIYGKKKVFISGLVVWVIFCIMAALCTNLGMMLVTVAFGGLGTAMCYSTIAAILTESFDQSERGRVLGGNLAVAYLGTSGGPFIGGIITQYLGWRAIFWTPLPTIVIALFLTLRFLPNTPSQQRVNFDRKGTLFYVSGLALFIIGVSYLGKSWSIAMLVLAFFLVYIFTRLEHAADHPLIHLEVFKNRVFTLSNLASLIHFGTTYATSLLLSMYLQDQGIKALSASIAGLILVAQPFTQIIFSPVAGRLSDRMEPRWLASSGMLVTALCLGALSFVQIHTDLFSIIIILLIMGTGFSFFVAPNNNAIMGSLPASQYGLASGVMATCRILGMSLSLAATTMILNKSGTAVNSSQGFMYGFQNCFITFSLCALIGIAASLARGSQKDSTVLEDKLHG
ncbi:MAG: MFS transporter [Syntrophomonas sp.]